MGLNIRGRLAHAWNAFQSEDKNYRIRAYDQGASYGGNPNRVRLSFSNERSIVSSIYTRIAIDVSSIALRHVRLDENGAYQETINSGLNNCLTVEANVDQAASAFRLDSILTLFDEGVVALVPIDTTLNPEVTGSYDIATVRVGKIVAWYPRHVRVSVYNDAPDKGVREEITVSKTSVAIIENPLYSVMNEPNSTLQRLIRKLNLLDTIDEQSGSGKLDLIIQLPYVIKTEQKRQQAEQRRKDIEVQLQGSKYGIAYTDGTEKVTQLNRPAENNLLAQVEYLTEMVYAQLGLTKGVFDGTANEEEMLNYYNRTVEPLLRAFAEAMRRSFLTKTARTQLQSVEFYRDVFKLVPIKELAEIADKFVRNKILTGNEMRGVVGYKPVSDPAADKLENPNIPPPAPPAPPAADPPAQLDAPAPKLQIEK